MASQSRLAFIDLLRGWAVLVMIEVHVFNAFLLSQFKETPWFQVLNFINGLVAPSFIFISGFVFLLASHKKLDSFRLYGSAFWKQISRIGLIWIVGYCLHLPFFSLHRTLTETVEKGWLSFYQSDVLHCIACGLLVLFLTRLAIRNDQTYRRLMLISGVLIVCAAFFLWDIDFRLWLPAPIAAYMNSRYYSLFPVFPWLGFMLVGGYCASEYIQARAQQSERNYIFKFALTGIILLVLCTIGREISLDLPFGSSDVRANPLFFFQRLGIVMMLLALCWYYAERRKTEKSFVLNVSRESLMVYAAHLLVIYGQFWNDHSLWFYYGELFGILECLAATLGLLIVMSAAAIVWGWMKKNHMPLARICFWMFTGTVVLWYCTH